MLLIEVVWAELSEASKINEIGRADLRGSSLEEE